MKSNPFPSIPFLSGKVPSWHFAANKQKKAIDMIPEDDTFYLHFADADPYFKLERTPDEQNRNHKFNENGHLTVHNYCAVELPKITVTIHSGQTTYRFSGSYDGTRSLPGKLLDHMTKENQN